MSRAAAARALSLTVAGALALGLMLTPQLLGQRATSPAGHVGLSLALLGLAGAFVHGFDYRPDHAALRILFSGWMSWALIAAGLWLVIGAGR